MRTIAFALFCLTSLAAARRVHLASDSWHDRQKAFQLGFNVSQSNTRKGALTELATILLAESEPQAAWQVTGHGRGSSVKSSSVSLVRQRSILGIAAEDTRERLQVVPTETFSNCDSRSCNEVDKTASSSSPSAVDWAKLAGRAARVAKAVREARAAKAARLARAAREAWAARAAPSPGKLVLLRHGQSSWNIEGRFTGWEDSPLTEQGALEAREAADTFLLSDPPMKIDVCYSSVLQRSWRTAEIFLERYSHQRDCPTPPLRARWRLNERHYGMLQGLYKKKAQDAMSVTDMRRWRSTFQGKPPPMEPDHPFYSRDEERLDTLRKAAAASSNEDSMVEPLGVEDVPLTESLADCRERVASLWESEIKPAVLGGSNVLVVSHANCLRALISCMQPGKINDESLPILGIPNAEPIVYEFDKNGSVMIEVSDKCYVSPIEGYYLSDACLNFNLLDSDQSGAIEPADLAMIDPSGPAKTAWTDELLQEVMGETDISDLMEEADFNGDGVINFNEYKMWLNDKNR